MVLTVNYKLLNGLSAIRVLILYNLMNGGDIVCTDIRAYVT